MTSPVVMPLEVLLQKLSASETKGNTPESPGDSVPPSIALAYSLLQSGKKLNVERFSSIVTQNGPLILKHLGYKELFQVAKILGKDTAPEDQKSNAYHLYRGVLIGALNDVKSGDFAGRAALECLYLLKEKQWEAGGSMPDFAEDKRRCFLALAKNPAHQAPLESNFGREISHIESDADLTSEEKIQNLAHLLFLCSFPKNGEFKLKRNGPTVGDLSKYSEGGCFPPLLRARTALALADIFQDRLDLRAKMSLESQLSYDQKTQETLGDNDFYFMGQMTALALEYPDTYPAAEKLISPLFKIGLPDEESIITPERKAALETAGYPWGSIPHILRGVLDSGNANGIYTRQALVFALKIREFEKDPKGIVMASSAVLRHDNGTISPAVKNALGRPYSLLKLLGLRYPSQLKGDFAKVTAACFLIKLRALHAAENLIHKLATGVGRDLDTGH